MITDLKPYPTYQDSGVDWLGQVPKTWSVLPLAAGFRSALQRNTGMHERTVLSLSYGQIVVKPEDKLHGLAPESFETYQRVFPGDIIVRTTDLQNDQTSLRVGPVKTKGIITSAYLRLIARENLNPEFGYLVLHAYDLMKVIYGYGSGLRQTLDFNQMKRIPMALPSASEQIAIVKLLGYADSRIERLIAIQERLIDLLEQGNKATVFRAVTRGLDASVSFRPSGVDWIGDMPKHWGIKELRHLGRVRGGLTPSMDRSDYWGGSIPWVSPKDMKRPTIDSSIDSVTPAALSGTGLRLVPPGSVLVVVRGMILARRVPVAVTSVKVTINQDMKAVVPTGEVGGAFLANALSAAQVPLMQMIDEAGHGTRRLPTDRWRRLPLPVPPLNEQRAIAAEIQRVTDLTEDVRQSGLRQIALLREYRARLISDVVTGKLDVREAAAKLSDDDDPALDRQLEEVAAG